MIKMRIMPKKKGMNPNTKKGLVAAFWVLFSIPVLAVLIGILWIWLKADIPSFEELESPESNLATLVLADDGKTVLSTFHIENRSYVTYDELSVHLVNAAVAT